MIACVDVDYREDEAIAACVLARCWTDAHSAVDLVEHVSPVAPYESGQFYRRELPCLLAVLKKMTEPVDVIVIDGYVWLADERPGLGAHLYHAMGTAIPVIGVAKTPFRGAQAARAVVRGGSHRPLYVTAAGIDVETAAHHVQGMHGPFRIPTLLKRVDNLCRQA